MHSFTFQSQSQHLKKSLNS